MNAPLLARYNSWMNRKLITAALTLPPHALTDDRRAFFGSILGTFNHLLVGDTIWLKRFRVAAGSGELLAPLDALPHPTSLRDTLFADLPGLAHHREKLDALIELWADALTDDELAAPLAYTNMRGDPYARRLGDLVQHFFNHQTHHRGQITTLLFQAGVDPGETDMLALIPC